MLKSIACVLTLHLASSFVAAQRTAAKVTIARWPQDRLAAISLTFDDGLNTHLDIVEPILKSHHLAGTFFVSTALGPWETRRPEWKRLAEEGNELANHTVHHPCLLEQIQPHSQDYTPEMMEAEVMDAAQEIERLVSTQRGLTFAYPCGNMSFGRPQDQVRNSALYLSYVSEHSFGARSVGPEGPQDPDELSVLAVNSLGPTDGKDFIGLLALAEPAIHRGLWGVYCFHGIGGDYLSVSRQAFEELASYLERHSEIWIATFGDVLRYTQERKAAFVQMTQNSDGSIDLALQWPMDAGIYDLPLTLKVEVGEPWRSATATCDGKDVGTRVAGGKDKAVILFEVAPRTKVVHVVRSTALNGLKSNAGWPDNENRLRRVNDAGYRPFGFQV